MSTPAAPFLNPQQLVRAQSAQWRQIVKQALTDTRCASPAYAVADMDPVTQTVKVQIAIKERSQDSTGKVTDVAIIPIKMVPVIIPRAGGFSVTLPVKKGDEGLLVFCDACFDFWWENGGLQTQNEVRRHYVHDCGFIPGMTSQPNVLQDYNMDAIEVRNNDGTTKITLDDDSVTTTVNDTKVTVTDGDVEVSNGGTALALVNDNFYQWFVTNVYPVIPFVGTPPPLPVNPETTVLKGE